MTRTPPRMRPEFDLPVPDDGGDVITALRTALAAPECPLYGQVRGQFAFVRHPDETRSLLSPHLNLELRTRDDGTTVLHGRFSPRPNVWTGFMALFFTIGLLGLCGLVYGLAQLTVGGSAWAMVAAPVSLALIAFIYGAAFIGQGLSAEEMHELRSFVEEQVRQVARG